MKPYLITTTWHETYVHHGDTLEEAVTNLLEETEELTPDNIDSCVPLNIPVVTNTPDTTIAPGF